MLRELLVSRIKNRTALFWVEIIIQVKLLPAPSLSLSLSPSRRGPRD